MTSQPDTPKGVNAAAVEARQLAADLFALSGGNAVAAHPSGPVFAPGVVRRRVVDPETFVDVLSPGRRAVVAALSAGWVLALVVFRLWWLQPSHRLGWSGFVLNTVLIAYLAVVPSYYLVVLNRLREVDPQCPVPALRLLGT